MSYHDYFIKVRGGKLQPIRELPVIKFDDGLDDDGDYCKVVLYREGKTIYEGVIVDEKGKPV